MKKKSNFRFLCWRACIALCLAVALALPVIAQNPYRDPSARVARLNYIQGSVSLQPGGEDDWVWASTNRPLTISDSVWTGSGSRAELHIGSTAIRVAPRTSFSFLNLDDNSVQIELNAGTMNVRVRNMYRGDSFEVDTPNIAFTLLRRGDYRITVDPDGSFTTVTVRSGEGQVDGGGQAFLVDAGSQVQVTGTDYISYDVYDLPDRDSFDRWANLRDVRESRSLSARYVSPEMTGYDDLDRYGTWRTDSNLGPIWMPTRVSSDWAPYRNGHWAWVDPWGWTWVDDAQFGFVTSHYGRWTHIDNGYGQGTWAWVPPQKAQTTYQRPVYSPALVTFVSVSTRDPRYSNDVTWVPLAPGEVYVPSFRASPNYVQQVNQTNTAVQQQVITAAVSNPQQVAPSANQKVAGAVTAVSKTAFASAQPVAAAAVKVDQQAVATAPAAAAAPVAPVKASIVTASAPPTKAAAPAPAPPAEVVSRQVVAKVAPPPPPVKFEKKQQALAATPGKPLDPRVEQNLRAETPAPAAVKPVITAPPATVKPATELPKKAQPAISPNVAKQEHPATPATGAPPPGQQRAEMARQQAAQQQAEKEKAQQLAAQERAEKEKAQQEAALAKQQAAQQQAEKEKAQQLAAQQQAEKERAQQLAAQQQAEKQKAEQLAAQQLAEKQKAQQLAAQQQAEKQRAQQQAEQAREQAAQQQAEKEKAQQLAAQQQAEKQKAQQQAAQAQREAEQARRQAAQQQAEKERAQQQAAQLAEREKAQQLAAQQEAERTRGRERQQMAQERAPAAPPEKQPNARQPGKTPEAQPGKAPEAQASSEPVRIPENVQAAKLISQPQLNAPANAHGMVRVRALIGVDGKVKTVTPLSGPPPLRAAAVENVKQRVYQPTLLNGKPVEVETEITIRF